MCPRGGGVMCHRGRGGHVPWGGHVPGNVQQFSQRVS